MFCMVGGFFLSVVCVCVYCIMICWIMFWLSLLFFGVCIFVYVLVELGGLGGEGEFDINLFEYEWLNWIYVIWFIGCFYELCDELC